MLQVRERLMTSLRPGSPAQDLAFNLHAGAAARLDLTVSLRRGFILSWDVLLPPSQTERSAGCLGVIDSELILRSQRQDRSLRMGLRGRGWLSLGLRVRPEEAADRQAESGGGGGRGHGNITMNLSLVRKSPPPGLPAFGMQLGVDPAALLAALPREEERIDLEGGRLLARRGSLASPVIIRAGADGSLSVAKVEAPGQEMGLRIAPGLFADRLAALPAVPATSAQPCVEVVDLLLGELEALMQAQGGSQVRALAALRTLRPWLRESLLPDLAGVWSTQEEDEERFTIPGGTGLPQCEPVQLLVWVLAQELSWHLVDRLPTGAWPRVLLRLLPALMQGRSQLFAADLRLLAEDPALGPVGCLATAALLRAIGHPAHGLFARLCRDRLDDDGFLADAALLRPWAARLAPALRALPAALEGSASGWTEAERVRLQPLLTALATETREDRLLELACRLAWAGGLRELVVEALGRIEGP